MSSIVGLWKYATVENIHNVSLFAISVSSLFSYVYYNSYSLPDKVIGGGIWFERLYPVVGIYAVVDFFLTKKTDSQLHHACILGIYFYNNYHSVSVETRFIFLYPLLITEISSIFLLLNHLIPKSSVLNEVNFIIFYFSFYKFRIWDFYVELIHNNTAFNFIFNRYSHSNVFTSVILLSSLYGLYILNLYWFLIINKILFKQIAKCISTINTDKINHLLCSYIHWVNIPLAIYIYSFKPNVKHIFDVVGITALTVSSFQYHHYIYNRLVSGQIDEYNVPDRRNIGSFINDTIFINIRNFFIILTNYYDKPLLGSVLCYSGFFHTVSMYCCVLNIQRIFQKEKTEKNKKRFSTIHDIITAIPIITDAYFIFTNSPTEIAIPFLMVNVVIGLLFAVEPFYKLNHAVFHLLVLVQNYYICMSNIQ